MTATTRWVQYDISSTGSTATTHSGTRGYSLAGLVDGSDSFTINASNNKLYFTTDEWASQNITLASGVDLDPRFIARDITEKIHILGASTVYDSVKKAQCVYENNKFKLYSGTVGSDSLITVLSGTNTVHPTLGWDEASEVGGSATATTSGNLYTGGVTISGTYNGLFDEVYTVVISKDWTIGTPVPVSIQYPGTISVGGVFNYTSDTLYTITIDTTNGTTMGAGTGNVPSMTWVSSDGNDDSDYAVELLYPDHYYKIGGRGLMVKFSDAFFGSGDQWTIQCSAPTHAAVGNTSAPAGTAKFIYGSDRGDDASASNITLTGDGTFKAVGTKGLFIRFDNSGMDLRAGDQFSIVCAGPSPYAPGITNLNFGNVTVSTESSVKCVMFEITSGATKISTVKFGLQSHGSFNHHWENNGAGGATGTMFRFGTVGPGNPSGGALDYEWYPNVTAGDLATSPTVAHLYASEANLEVVSDADDSETIGSSGFRGMTADPIWLNIKLDGAETGANSTINYRIYFDYI